jgi:ribose transport system ATP-binding protein
MTTEPADESGSAPPPGSDKVSDDAWDAAGDEAGVEAGAAADPPPLILAEGITKVFGATRALDRASLAVGRGEIHCLLGENGAGKSTLGRIIGGLYPPGAGRLVIDGAACEFRGIADARARGVAIVHQELSLAPDLTVRENLCLGTEPGRAPWRRLRHRTERAACRELLASLGLEVDLERRTGTLPAATQQLIEVAKALLLRPRLVVMDEPSSMLGAVEKSRLFALLRRLKGEGTALLFITHHIEDVLELGDRVSIMKDGVVIDTFAVDDGLDPDHLLELLAGRKLARADAAAQAGWQPTLLRITGLGAKEGGACELAMTKGEIVGLYGVVGCGRETIAAALVGLASPPGIAITLDGRPYRPRTVAEAGRRGVGYLPAGRAQHGILPTQSVGENLMLTRLPALGRGGFVSRRAEERQAKALLQQLGVRYRRTDEPITRLSGGNQQKTVLGRAFGRGTRLLVLEDPTAGIDIGAKFEIHEQIRKKAEDGISVILMSSDLVETLTLCHTVYSMHRGAIVRRYPDPSLADQPDVISDVLGRAGVEVENA